MSKLFIFILLLVSVVFCEIAGVAVTVAFRSWTPKDTMIDNTYQTHFVRNYSTIVYDSLKMETRIYTRKQYSGINYEVIEDGSFIIFNDSIYDTLISPIVPFWGGVNIPKISNSGLYSDTLEAWFKSPRTVHCVWETYGVMFSGMIDSFMYKNVKKIITIQYKYYPKTADHLFKYMVTNPTGWWDIFYYITNPVPNINFPVVSVLVPLPENNQKVYKIYRNQQLTNGNYDILGRKVYDKINWSKRIEIK